MLAENHYIVSLPLNAVMEGKIDLMRKSIDKVHSLECRAPGCDIMLARFQSLEARETILIRSLEKVAAAVDPILISLRGVEAIPSHSYRIPAVNKIELNNLVKKLKSITKSIKSTGSSPWFCHDFGILLFAQMRPADYEKIFYPLKDSNVNIHGLCDALKLVRKRSTYSPWEEWGRFSLQKQQQSIQPTLF